MRGRQEGRADDQEDGRLVLPVRRFVKQVADDHAIGEDHARRDERQRAQDHQHAIQRRERPLERAHGRMDRNGRAPLDRDVLLENVLGHEMPISFARTARTPLAVIPGQPAGLNPKPINADGTGLTERDLKRPKWPSQRLWVPGSVLRTAPE